ncbi:hypothetical protein BVX99_01355 [bacterium F16]|nr:hypothetical protein BVX99_01355 [bacterium F16]
MHANMAEAIVMADVLSGQALGRRAFETLFVAEVGSSPMNHLRSIRLRRIRYLLRTTDLTVKEIGRQCGIPNITYLCRLFQKIHGVTPKQYREQR